MASFNTLSNPMRREIVLHKPMKSYFPKLGSKAAVKSFLLLSS